jgi:hypothetical protein
MFGYCMFYERSILFVLSFECRGSVLAFNTQVRGFKPGRSRRIFKGEKSSTRLPSEGK